MKHLKKSTCSIGVIIAIITGYSYILGNEPAPEKSVGLVTINGKEIGILHVSTKALEVIGDAEGCRRAPYTCPAGLATDGIGNTNKVKGEVKTDDQIADDWTRNIISAQDCLFQHADTTALTQGQFDAFVSFIFNTGCRTFLRNKDGTSTRIYRKIKNHQYTAACNELPFWVYGGGKKLLGLINRRKKELQLCLTPDK